MNPDNLKKEKCNLPGNWGIGYAELPMPQAFATGYADFSSGNSLVYLDALLDDLVQYDWNILFAGERGTGKEVFAQKYIEKSGRGERFESINCAGLNESTLSSQLYGHIKGAFTGASESHKGLIETVNNGGGIFLDELGDASDDLKAGFLRVLQTKEYLPIGATESKKITDVRFIAATSKAVDLREDLQDRFLTIYLPPLRNRIGDINQIIQAVWTKLTAEVQVSFPNKISFDALQLLKSYEWPGNVRELQNLLQIALILSIRNGESVLRCGAFPHLQKESKADNSRKFLIKNLGVESTPAAMKDFLIPPKNTAPLYTENEINRQSSDDEIMTTLFESTTPDEYTKGFWAYHAKKGSTGKKIASQFPSIKAGTANNNLKKARDFDKTRRSKK